MESKLQKVIRQPPEKKGSKFVSTEHYWSTIASERASELPIYHLNKNQVRNAEE